jgi:hypothetical protein
MNFEMNVLAAMIYGERLRITIAEVMRQFRRKGLPRFLSKFSKGYKKILDWSFKMM